MPYIIAPIPGTTHYQLIEIRSDGSPHPRPEIFQSVTEAREYLKDINSLPQIPRPAQPKIQLEIQDPPAPMTFLEYWETIGPSRHPGLARALIVYTKCHYSLSGDEIMNTPYHKILEFYAQYQPVAIKAIRGTVVLDTERPPITGPLRSRTIRIKTGQ